MMLQERKSPTSDLLQALPPESPLVMPEQSLLAAPPTTLRANTGPRWVAMRRLMLVTLCLALTFFGAYEMYAVLQVAGLTAPETVILILFVMLLAWISFSFVSSIGGVLNALDDSGRLLGIDPTQPLPDLRSRTALLLPTYNEDPGRVAARLRAMWHSICATGQEDRFDIFILSDSTDPAVWIAEEAEFLRLRKVMPTGRVYYRHRASNSGRKAGNIADWVRRFGGGYDQMIVLDADSLMEGATIALLAAAMERNPDVGLIQTLPILINGETLFARVQQFANRVYGPHIARGFAWWHGSESNYWGHNAIIRVRAFADHAGLPELQGRKPFGGHILSHDFVEAALLRRAGWGIHLVTRLGGSYEECPPTLSDYAARDRRWCQGNLQHIAVVRARGLHWVSRLHLMMGVGCYLTAPLWLLFLLLGIVISLQAQFIRPDYFPAGATLFPQWPAQDPVRAAWVFVGTMGLLLVPKLFGYLSMLPRRSERHGINGGLVGLFSVILETIISALLAPIMMLMQSKAVIEILLGHDSGWNPQRRNNERVSMTELARGYAVPTVLGVILLLAAYAVSLPLLIWMLPVLLGLVLAVPIAAITSLDSAGGMAKQLGLLTTPEERSPPAILVHANALARDNPHKHSRDPIAQLAQDAVLREAHLDMLPARTARARGEVDVDLVVALAKIDQAESQREAAGFLTRSETIAVLNSRNALFRIFSKTGNQANAESFPKCSARR